MVVAHFNKNTTEEERRLPLFVYTVGYTDRQESIHRPMGMPMYQLLYTRKGKGLVRLPQGEQIVHEGQVLMLPPFVPHDYGAYEGYWETCWVTYGGSMTGTCFPFLTDIREDWNFLRSFEAILSLRVKKNWRRQTSAHLYEMLLSYSEAKGLCEMPAKSRSDVDIALAVGYISEHYCETVELSTLSQLVGLSDGHFCRVFREYTHMRPIEYITHLRIELAKSILEGEREASISSVASRCGFDSPGYFSYVFRKYVGMAPGDYRKTEKNSSST